MLELVKTAIDQVFELKLSHFEDERGSFTKIFRDSLLRKEGIDFQMKESYFSCSKKNVIRGMHFQSPPFQHHKVVYCPQGALLDVVVDLRKKSPTYGQYVAKELSADNHRGLFIPEGCAHGFKSLEDNSMTVYLVSSEYHKEADTGILWSSFGMDWACEQPLLSERDQSFLPLSELNTPF